MSDSVSLETLETMCRQIRELHEALLLVRIRLADAIAPPHLLDDTELDAAALEQLWNEASPALSRLLDAIRTASDQARAVESALRSNAPAGPS